MKTAADHRCQTDTTAQSGEHTRGSTAVFSTAHPQREVGKGSLPQLRFSGQIRWARLPLAQLKNRRAERRVVGSPAIMRDQLLHLAEMTRHPKFTVQVLPCERGAHPGMAAGPVPDSRFPAAG
ncbi:Scr1 family TA system antitoxin-like transcriptional regulator [Streptomyces sp. NPDC057543]|uniref:Scr1 family TA system antitoxin-like transcriptional regulator n=1 Tax=Streptomyces sp. NPDC057543 TaxID=3346163 RepID=UPI0036AA58A7